MLYLGRALRTKETLPDFQEWRRVTRHSRVFQGLTGSQWTPGFWGVTVNVVHIESSQEEVEPIDGPISFPSINPNKAIVPHYDALVLTLYINGFNVHRVLVYPGSAADLLQLPAFIQIKLSSDMLNSAKRILSGFNGATTTTLGDVTLLVKVGPVTHRVLFSVIEDLGHYNVIVGRT